MRSAVLTVFSLCILSSTVVQAQKTPSIFKTEGGDKGKSTSSTNMAYINELEGLASGTGDAAKIARNKLIFIGVEQVDTEFNNYRKKSRKRNDLLQFIFDFLEVGATTAIAITNGERAKEVIAEALTGFKGGRTSFTKTFRLMEAQILFNKMVANRSKRLSAIYDRLNDDVESYPWERARSELRDYLYAGTIDDALSGLSVDTGAEANAEKANLEEVKKLAGIVGATDPDVVAAMIKNFTQVRNILRVGVVAERAVAAEKAKPAASQVKATIDAQEAIKKGVLDDLRALFDVINANPKLKALLDRIPEESSQGDDAERIKLEGQLNRIRENKDPTLADYDSILLKLNELASIAVKRDPALAADLNAILAASKTLKAK
jgi:hypothetical protein